MDNKDKFTDKAENYAKYRPSYPNELIDYLQKEVGLLNGIIADIGAGTGILTKLLAPIAKKVYAIEPNQAMRHAFEQFCENIQNIELIDGYAEETGLPDNSVDFITAAQAFHWSDKNRCSIEFQRILKKNGKVILVWNKKESGNLFMQTLESILLNFCPNFTGFAGGTKTSSDEENHFFLRNQFEYRVFDNVMLISQEEFIGGTLSSSYAPTNKDKHYNEFIAALTALFQQFSVQGSLFIPNKTHSYVGEMMSR